MNSSWPDGWKSATLTLGELPVSDFTLKALQAWSDSTPILPYTNNPLGMPWVKGKTSQLMQTGYAMFPRMNDFRHAFYTFLTTSQGQAVRDALSLGEKYSDLWRAVHVLPWPANKTETDWPSAILDLTSQSYRDSVATVASPSDRKTSGAYGASTGFGDVSGASARSAAGAANAIQQATQAASQITRRLT